MTAPTGRFLMVALQPDLHHSRVSGLFYNIMELPGVVSVTDLAAIGQETLDVILRKPEPVPERKRRKGKAA